MNSNFSDYNSFLLEYNRMRLHPDTNATPIISAYKHDNTVICKPNDLIILISVHYNQNYYNQRNLPLNGRIFLRRRFFFEGISPRRATVDTKELCRLTLIEPPSTEAVIGELDDGRSEEELMSEDEFVMALLLVELFL